MKVLVFPRDRNPYQERLHAEMRRRGAAVRYLGEATPSRTLNLLLLPAELVLRRLSGWRTVHLHWVWGFAPPDAPRLPVTRRVARWWFGAFLATTRLLGQRLVWTAHNALPHEPVFDDDLAARRALVAAADLVIVHGKGTVGELGRLGVRPRRVARIPHGPLGRPDRRDGGDRIAADGVVRLAFVGRVQPYKGVVDLLTAMSRLADAPLRLQVVGACPDPVHRAAVEALAATSPHPVALTLAHVPDEHLEEAVLAADAVVLPFRRATTSGSAILALELGRPVIVPDLPGLADLPDDAVVRYDGSLSGLTDAIRGFVAMPAAARARLRDAAARFAPPPWSAIAEATLAELAALGARDAAAPSGVREAA